jgi:hypothetical protein
MAINVNKVYRVVLAILNKEQRGYLTPDQFNRLGRQAQLDLFEKSFYDYNRQLTKRNIQGVNSEYGDIADNIEEKIDLFAKSATLTLANNATTVAAPADLYRTVNITTSDRSTEIEKIKKSEYVYYASSQLSAPTASFPVYYFDNNVFNIFPASITNPVIDYIKIPSDPVWGYTSGANASYTYNSDAYDSETGSGSRNFELHPSDETDLVIKILALAGVIIKDPAVIQVAQQQEANNVTLENS